MASLRRIPRSKYWIACITLSDGRQTQRSTKCTDRRKALAVANQFESAENDAKFGHLTEYAARKHISKTFKIVNGIDLKNTTVRVWLSDWLDDAFKSKREGTAKKYKSTILKFLEVIGDRADFDIRHISHSDAKNFRDYLIQSGKSNKSINVELKIVVSPFLQALRQRLIDVDPFATLSKLPEEGGVRKHFTGSQVHQILKYAHGEWSLLVQFGYYTGLRLGDLTQLKWGNLKIGGELPLVEFTEIKKQEKHKRKVVVPLHPVLVSLINNEIKQGASSYLFPKLQPIGTGGNSGLSQSFRRILVNAGIVKELYQKKKEGSVGRTVSPYSFHSLRHSFKTELANKGVAADIRDVLSGHAKPSVAEAYVHRDASVLMDAIRLLPDLKVA